MKALLLAAAPFALLSAQELLTQVVPDTPPAQTKAMRIESRSVPGLQAVQVFSSEMGSSAVVKNSPYSGEAVTETVQMLSDGNKITRKNTVMQYRDSEGRTRREFELQWLGKLGDAEGGASKSISIDDPVAKVHFALDTANKMADKIPTGEGMFTAAVPAPPPPPPGVAGVASAPLMGVVTSDVNQVFARQAMPAGTVSFATTTMMASPAHPAKEEDLGSRNIEGVVAKGTRSTVTIPAGEVGNEREISVVTEKWYSDQLKTYVLTKHSDPRFGETTHKLTNVRLSEPPASLFEVPADFTMREPQMRGPMMIRKRGQE